MSQSSPSPASSPPGLPDGRRGKRRKSSLHYLLPASDAASKALAPVALSEYTFPMSNSSITVKVAWDPEAKVFYTEYTDLLGLKLEAKTLDEFREKLPGAIQDLTGRQVPFLIELDNVGQHETYREEDFFEQWITRRILP
jgi:hypothetical protein